MPAPRPSLTAPVPAPAQDAPRWQFATFCALIFFAALIAYAPALHGDFLWDDGGHVTRPDLRSVAGLGRIWFELGATQQYYPALHSAFWLEHRLWGDSVFGYHLLNVLLHATSACLFAFLLTRLAVPGAWLAAFLFALHPVCVESVAWISEQKNTLATVFYIAAAIYYIRFDGSRGVGHYIAATALFLLALFSKTVTATLPAALLVIFWWRRGRLDARRDVLPLLPWFLASALCGAITSHVERTFIGAEGADFHLSFVQRGLLAGRVFWFYLGKLLWPSNLIFIYPRWTIDSAQAWQWLFPLAALLLLAALLGWRKRGPLAAALLFGGALFPALGFFNVYPFLYSYVADHFQYLASLPVFAFAAACFAGAGARVPAWVRGGAACVLVGTLGVITWNQASIYRNPTTLYQTTIDRNPDCWMAHNNLAIELANVGHVEEAVPHLQVALKLRPTFAQAENNWGDDLVRLNRVPEAIPHFERAVQLQPAYAVAHRNLGMALAMTDHLGGAIEHFARAVEIDPKYAEAELDWAMALAQTARYAEAVPHFERALARMPDSAEAHESLAFALRKVGRTEEAQAHAAAAERLKRATAP